MNVPPGLETKEDRMKTISKESLGLWRKIYNKVNIVLCNQLDGKKKRERLNVKELNELLLCLHTFLREMDLEVKNKI